MYRRIVWGFNPDELWSLDHTIARFMAKRLPHFRSHLCGHPCSLTEPEWGAILAKMEKSFQMVAAYEEDGDGVEEGLDLFRKYFMDLWD